ncbi:MAG: SDR family oxidoreductase [Lysobacterales bacterium]
MQTLITGANRGLGLEFTRQCLARGERVLATARDPGHAQALNRLAGEYPGHLTVLPLDMTQPASIEALASEIALLGVSVQRWVANAGVLHRGERFGTLDAATLEHAWRVNTLGPLLLAQALTPQLPSGARVVFLSSILGSISARDSFYVPGYCISKAGLNMVMRQLSYAWAPKGILTIAAHPGWVRTEMGGEQAPLLPEQSVSDLLRLIDNLTPDHHGRFYAHDGTALAW